MSSISVNKVILQGNLGMDPETTQVNNQTKCRFTLATNDTYFKKDGEKVTRTTWHNITVWGKQAESCGEYLKKGRQVYLEGRIDNRSYEDQGVKKFFSEVVASIVKFGPNGNGEKKEEVSDEEPKSDDKVATEEDFDDLMCQ